ncbi:MAG: hypothetical protein KDA16_10510 [Phycisphaerales bacterium]|nr:hypothetical protein [Phycisphaerales bacterium]
MAALSRFWSLACGLGLPAAAAVLSATGQQSGLPAASFALSAGFLGAAGSIWQNLYAGSRQQREGEEAAERQRIFNHDLAKAVARSIATLLVPLTRSSSLPEQERKALRTMAEHAQVVWLRVIETDAPAFEPLLEENLADSIAANPNDPALGPYGDIRMWRDLLTRMAGETGPGVAKALTGDCAAIHEASKRCQQEFARQFFNDLKHDFATKGQAFAAVHLRMMGELIVLVREQARFNSELRARFDTIVDAVSNRGEEVVAWIGDDSAKGHRRLASLRPVTTWLKTIDARLGAIDNKVGQILQALRRIEKQGVRTEQTIQRESTRLHAQLEEEGKATRRRFRPVLIGLLSVLLVAMVFGGIYLFTSRKQTTMLHDSTESARRAALLGEQARDRLDSINAYLRLHLDDVSVANNSTPGFHSAIELVVESLAEEGELPQETWRTLTRFEVALITNSQADLDALSRLGRIEWTKSPITYEVTFADAVRFVCEAAGVPLRPLQQAEDELGDCYYFMEDEMEPLSDFRGTAYDLLNEVTRVAFADFCSVDWGLDKGAIVFGSRVNLFESESRAITNAIWRPSDLADAFERFGSNYLYDIGDSVTPVPSEGYAIARRHLE